MATTTIFLYGGFGSIDVSTIGDAIIELEKRSVVFKRWLLECDSVLDSLKGFSIKAAMMSQDISILQDYAIVVETILGICFTKLFQSWGDQRSPDAAVGHGVGELSALFCCKALSLLETLSIAVRCSEAFATCGGMLVGLEVDSSTISHKALVQALMPLSISARNSANHVTIGGSLNDYTRNVDAEFRTQHRAKRLSAPAAYHTPLMDSGLVKLAKVLDVNETYSCEVYRNDNNTNPHAGQLNSLTHLRALMVRHGRGI
jgi:acyl transferase domain-containing protein